MKNKTQKNGVGRNMQGYKIQNNHMQGMSFDWIKDTEKGYKREMRPID